MHQPPVAPQFLLVPEIRKLLLIMSVDADLFGGEPGLDRFRRRHCRVSRSCSRGERAGVMVLLHMLDNNHRGIAGFGLYHEYRNARATKEQDR